MSAEAPRNSDTGESLDLVSEVSGVNPQGGRDYCFRLAWRRNAWLQIKDENLWAGFRNQGASAEGFSTWLNLV